MDLLEYQAKVLFSEVGIPVPPSQPIAHLRDLKDLQLPYPIALKSQVRAGGRGRRGGIRFATNTIDAVAAAQAIFALSIDGEYPDLLLAEAKVKVERELYLAVAIDYGVRRPVLLGSIVGGEGATASLDLICRETVTGDFSPFLARRLALAMGLRGPLLRTVSAIAVKMYRLLVRYDLDSIEINPLGITADGQAIALDGKVTVNDGALGRHRHLVERLGLPVTAPTGRSTAHSGQVALEGSLADLGWSPLSIVFDPPGEIAVACTGMGLMLATVDAIVEAGGKPAAAANLGWDVVNDGHVDLERRLQAAWAAFDRLHTSQNIQAILIVLAATMPTDQAIAAISREIQQRRTDYPPTRTVPTDHSRQPRPTASRDQDRRRSLWGGTPLLPATPPRSGSVRSDSNKRDRPEPASNQGSNRLTPAGLPTVIVRAVGPTPTSAAIEAGWLTIEPTLLAAVKRAVAAIPAPGDNADLLTT